MSKITEKFLTGDAQPATVVLDYASRAVYQNADE
jgi:hypothetical protein